MTDEGGERWERWRRQVKRPERVAAVDSRQSCSVSQVDIGHRNRKTTVHPPHPPPFGATFLKGEGLYRKWGTALGEAA